MPGSLLSRNESTRSDDSSRKVSFNRAVKVKNYPQKEGEQRRRFWFRPKSERPSHQYHESVLSGSSEDDERKNLSPILESPLGRPNHVKDMVHMFSQDHRGGGNAYSSPTPPPFTGSTASRFREEDESFQRRSSPGPYRTKIIISDESNDSSGHQSPYGQYAPESLEQCLGEFNRVMDHLSTSRKMKQFEDDGGRIPSSFERRKGHSEQTNYKSGYVYSAKDKIDAPSQFDSPYKWKDPYDYSEDTLPKHSTPYTYRDSQGGHSRIPSPKNAGKYTDQQPLTYKADAKDFHFFNNEVKYAIDEEPLSALPEAYKFDEDEKVYKNAKTDEATYKSKNGEHFSNGREIPIYRENGQSSEKRVNVRKELSPESHANGTDPTLSLGRKNLSRHFWDSGDRLISSSHQVKTSKENTPEGQLFHASGEQSNVWGRRQETVYEEEPWRRRAVSHDNLHMDQNSPTKTPRLKKSSRGVSTTELYIPEKAIDDKAIQCNGSVRFVTSPIRSDSSSKPRVIKSRNGMVSAFSDVPVLETSAFSNHTRCRSQDSYLGNEQPKGEVIYSQVDLSKKKRNRLNHSSDDGYSYKSPSRSYRFGSTPALHELEVSSNASSSRETRMRTTKKGFGLKLGSVFSSRRSDDSRISPKYHRGVAESHDELDSSDTSLIPEAVVRDYDHKNKVINYENVPHQKPKDISSREGGLWFNASDEDYRRGMAQDDVTCVGTAQVFGTDPSYATMSRLEKAKKEDTPLTVTSYTLDRKHLRRDQNKLSPPTLMVNGHRLPPDIDERRSRGGNSAASDTSSARGGLAAAYQARQRAATRNRSSSRSTPPSSSDSESARRNHRRRTLVMYIPGVGHEGRLADEDDRSSGITVARSQSILSSRPPRARPRRANAPASPELRRRHSIPKNAKFPWFKWRIKAKPSREP